MKKLILTVSIGDRPWADCTINSMQMYAKKIGADFRLVSEYEVPDIFDFELGRRNNKAYLIKLLVIQDAFKEYDRIIFLDDTCVVSHDCPDLFQIVPPETFGAHNEGILKFVRADIQTSERLAKAGFNNIITPQNYINLGLMVITKSWHADIFSDENIIAHGKGGYNFFLNAYPEQTYVNYILASQRRACFYLPAIFNLMMPMPNNLPRGDRVNYENLSPRQTTIYIEILSSGELLKDEDVRLGSAAGAYIYHITSACPRRNREKLIRKLYDLKVARHA